MGMFDYITFKYPLPNPTAEQGTPSPYQAHRFQTKNTHHQFLDEYIVLEDGTLWYTDYDTEDRSDPNAEGIMKIAGMLTRVNERQVRDSTFTGEIRFYNSLGKEGAGWIEYSAYFVDGRLQQIHLIEESEPDPVEEKARADRLKAIFDGERGNPT